MNFDLILTGVLRSGEYATRGEKNTDWVIGVYYHGDMNMQPSAILGIRHGSNWSVYNPSQEDIMARDWRFVSYEEYSKSEGFEAQTPVAVNTTTKPRTTRNKNAKSRSRK